MISDKRKQRIKDKAIKAATKANAPEAKQIATARKRATKTYTNQVAASKAAAQQVEAALLAAIGSARASGLKGRYLKSTIAELKAQKGDAQAMIPYTRSQLRPDYIDTLQSLHQQNRELERSTAQSARDALQTRLQDIREAQKQKAEDRRTRVQEHKSATIVMHEVLDENREIAQTKIPPPPDDATDKEIAAYHQAIKDRKATQEFLSDLYDSKQGALRHFAALLATKTSLDQSEAMQFIRRMMARKREAAIANQEATMPDLPDWFPGPWR